MQSLKAKLGQLSRGQKILLLVGGLIFLCVCLCCPAGFFFQPSPDIELAESFMESEIDLESIPEVAAPAEPPTLAPPSKSDVSNLYVEYVLDASAIMNKPLPDGRSKIEVAAEQIRQNLDGHHPGTNLGLRIYGHRHAQEDSAGSCQDTELVVPIDRGNHETIADWLQEPPPARGLTSLTTSLEEASHNFSPDPNRINVIILVSGSGETCQRDPCALVNQWQVENRAIAVHAVGFNVEEGARQQLQCIAQAGRGTYYDATTAEALAHALFQIQQTIKREEVVVPAAMAMMPTPTATPLPTPTATRVVINTSSSAEGRIAFTSMRADLNNEIFVIAANGGEQSRITHFTSSAIFPDWSPDGQHLAFSSNHEGDFEIYVSNADGSGLTRLTNTPGEDTRPAWSPDGNRLAFASARNDAGCGTDCNFEIYVMNTDGSQQINLTNNPANDDDPDWSPDGQHLVFASDREGNAEIYTLNVNSQELARLTNHPEPDTGPAWSPDGGRIAFESRRDGNFEIYLINADGSNPARLTHNEIWDAWPAWSPTSTGLAFASQRDGVNFDIYTITIDGSSETRLTDHSAFDLHPSWSLR